MKKLSILSCVLLLAIALLAPGCKKKEDASDKEQKSEVKVSAEETVKASDYRIRQDCFFIKLLQKPHLNLVYKGPSL